MLFKYANEELSTKTCTNLHIFPELKPDSKFLFDFVDILVLNVFPEGIWNFSFYDSIKQKNAFCHVFRIKCCINQCE